MKFLDFQSDAFPDFSSDSSLSKSCDRLLHSLQSTIAETIRSFYLLDICPDSNDILICFFYHSCLPDSSHLANFRFQTEKHTIDSLFCLIESCYTDPAPIFVNNPFGLTENKAVHLQLIKQMNHLAEINNVPIYFIP